MKLNLPNLSIIAASFAAPFILTPGAALLAQEQLNVQSQDSQPVTVCQSKNHPNPDQGLVLHTDRFPTASEAFNQTESTESFGCGECRVAGFRGVLGGGVCVPCL